MRDDLIDSQQKAAPSSIIVDTCASQKPAWIARGLAKGYSMTVLHRSNRVVHSVSDQL